MTLAHYLLRNPDLAHGPIRIAFTPDEEIGRGVHPNLPRDLKAEAAYTLDGADQGEVVFETFSADKAAVTIQGVSTHPGDAKDELVNALHLAAKIVMTLPHVTLTPETTNGRHGFIHLYQMSGTAAEAELHFIVRDFERDCLRAHGELIQQVCATVQATEPRASITCAITPQYRNMRDWLEKDMRPVELAREACRQLGIEPISTPIRGGTNGSPAEGYGVPTPTSSPACRTSSIARWSGSACKISPPPPRYASTWRSCRAVEQQVSPEGKQDGERRRHAKVDQGHGGFWRSRTIAPLDKRTGDRDGGRSPQTGLSEGGIR